MHVLKLCEQKSPDTQGPVKFMFFVVTMVTE